MKGINKVLVVFTISVIASVGILYALIFYSTSRIESKNESSINHQEPNSLASKHMLNTNELVPQQIMKEVKQHYDSFLNYESEGYIRESNPHKKLITQETYFNLKYEYPSKIEINWTINSLKKTFSGNKKSTFLTVDGRLIEKFDDPFWGLLALSSRENANLFEIGKILLGKEKSSDDYFTKDVSIEPTVVIEEIDGVMCYKISTGLPLNYNGQIIYWVETDSLLIKKIQKEIKFNKDGKSVYSYTEIYTKILAK